MHPATLVFLSLGFLTFPQGEEIGPMSGVAIGHHDEIYVLHRGPKPLMAFDKSGKFVRSWGEGLFDLPHGLRVARDGTIWTTDNKKNNLRQFSPGGKLLNTIEAGFKAPDDMVFTSNGDIIVADTGNARIVRLSPKGEVLSSWGKKGKEPGEFTTAHGLAIDAQDHIYVADRGNNRIEVFTGDGKLLHVWTGFGNPFGLHVTHGQLVISDGDAHRITHLSLKDGSIVGQWGDPQMLQLPHLMAEDSKGILYIAEVNGKRVQKFKRK
ncbi:MAG: peptidyl-alpha-hydroxyglycine alpha-amidating lyase family protein [Acidobacteriota bacterium]